MESDENKAAAKPSTPSVPHKRPKELSVNHAAAVAAAKTESAQAATKAAPAASNAAPSPFKPAPATPKTAVGSATTGSSLGTASAIAARERAEAAKEQLRMRAEARRNFIEEAKKEEIQQRPPIKRPASLSVNQAAATATAKAAGTAASSAKMEEIKKRPPIKRPASLSVNRAAATAAATAETAASAKTEEPQAKSEPIANQPNSPFKPLDRLAERAIYSTPGLRPRKSAEDHQKIASAPDQLGLGKAISAQKPEAPYSRDGRSPMWATPGTGRMNPFKPSAEAAAEPAQKPAVDEKAEAPSGHTSIADHTTHRSAFFDRADKARTPAPESEKKDPAIGDMTRSATKGKAPHAPVKGMSLEGKDSSILNNGARPTATKPLPGFKPVDGNK